MDDKTQYTAVLVLGAISFACVVGIAVLGALSKPDGHALTAIGSGAVGGILGMFTQKQSMVSPK